MRRERRRGFTLVELLVVIAIIGVLMAILVPALSKARAAAYTVKCSSNLRAIAQGLLTYVTENKGTFPAAYIYVGQAFADGQQTPLDPTSGYIHWSSYLFKRSSGGGEVPQSEYMKLRGWEMFTCPALERGGLAPANTYDANHDPGQQNDVLGVIDQQAPRIAYTVNEAIMPRNKFTKSWPGQTRTYQYVRISSIKSPNNVILATEFIDDWHVVTEDTGEGAAAGHSPACKSHRPVHGFRGILNDLDMFQAPTGAAVGRTVKGYQILKVTKEDLIPNMSAAQSLTSKTRLNWVGRNHSNGKSNFAFVDGHVETKTIEETLAPKFQWGTTFYSLNPHGDVEPTEF
jgi:prepilin-type N-terminal cleavage/methylation domain-containing protein/prepilin-type processing-associated H-X9-DG protein